MGRQGGEESSDTRSEQASIKHTHTQRSMVATNAVVRRENQSARTVR